MTRLYKFFFLLFLVLTAVSFVYATLMGWAGFETVKASIPRGAVKEPVPLSAFLGFGITQGLLYALMLFLFILFMINRSIKRQQKFTLRNIIMIVGWFFLVTTVFFGLYFLNTHQQLSSLFSNDGLEVLRILLSESDRFTLPLVIWWAFPVAWLSLFLLLAARFNKTA